MKVNYPIGLEIYNPVIYDKHGLFYENTGLRKINLPIGEYSINGPHKIIPFIKYELPVLPFREKLFVVPKLDEIKLEVRDDIKAKGQIDVHQRLMQIRKDIFYNATSPEFFAIYYHEIGHFLYYTEWKCDVFAIYHMLKAGFNPSQFQAFFNVLKSSEDRKIKVLETAKKSDHEKNGNRGNFVNWVASIFRRKEI